MEPVAFPNLYRAAGEKLFADVTAALQPHDLHRVEADLRTLRRFMKDNQLRHHYIKRIPSERIGVIAEMFAVARAANYSLGMIPHVPGPNGRNFDARIEFPVGSFGLEVKHQRDRFPFDGPSREVPEAGRIYEGLRPGAEPKFTGSMPPPGATKQVSGSQIWRDALEEAAAQLPQELPGIVAVSVDAFGGFEIDIEDALLGDHYVEARLQDDGSIVQSEERFGNGVFGLESFGHVTAVWFFKLYPSPAGRDDENYVRMCVWARGCGNSGATLRVVPPELESSLPNVYDKLREDLRGHGS